MRSALARVLLFKALLGLAVSGWATPPGPPPPPPFEELAQTLELRPEQMEPVRAAFDNARAARRAQHEANREQRIATREALDRQLAELLTPEQMQKLQEWRRSHPRPGPGRHPMGPRGEGARQ